ncbi:MAG: HAMP domain-containing protein [Melioribacteraceae bacterium]|nr:HAMP domain-containing protein [Melioribacteraceae bacterium]
MLQTLKSKIIFVIVLVVVFFGAAILNTFITLANQKSDGTVINLAGKQRMLIQKMTKEVLLFSRNQLEASEVRTTEKLFSKTLSGLINGDSELNLPPTENETILNNLKLLRNDWVKFSKKLENILAGIDSENSLSYVIENNVKILNDMNSIVGQYEEETATRVSNLQFTMSIFFVLTLIIGIVSISLSRKFLFHPLNSIVKAAKRIADGDVDFQLTVKGKDEIGILRNNFNIMINNIAKASDDLLNEKENVEIKVFEATRDLEEQKLYLSKNVHNLLTEMQRFENGDLSVNLPVEKDDEIGRLINGFNKSVLNLKKIISNIVNVTAEVIEAGHEISENSEQLAHGNEMQITQTDDFSRSINDISQTIGENTENVSSAARLANLSGENANESVKIIHATLEGMEKISDLVLSASGTVKKLGSKSDEIGEILQVIEDIADQTNLLALNAAIEAARAGESGRGFAVVADEVRKLAERTTKATKEIGVMIKEIQDSTNEAVDSMNEGAEQVNKGREMGVKAGDSLKQILNSTSQVSQSVNQVAVASEQQNSSIEEIKNNVGAFVEISGDSVGRIQSVTESAETLSNHLLGLKESLSFFNFKESKRLAERTVRIDSREFDIAINAHEVWKLKLPKILKGQLKAASSEVLSATECQLGKMYNSNWKSLLSSNKNYQELGIIHERMHNRLKEAVNCLNNNRVSEANKFANEVYSDASNVVKLLTKLKQEYN